MNKTERAKFLADRAKVARTEHRRALKLLAVTLVVLGGFIGIYLEQHGFGFIVEATGLYLVELI